MLHVCFGKGARGAQSPILENSGFFPSRIRSAESVRSSVTLSALIRAPDLSFEGRPRSKKLRLFCSQNKMPARCDGRGGNLSTAI